MVKATALSAAGNRGSSRAGRPIVCVTLSAGLLLLVIQYWLLNIQTVELVLTVAEN
jgi:hypothetical protein